jgi:hypothetical protein
MLFQFLLTEISNDVNPWRTMVDIPFADSAFVFIFPLRIFFFRDTVLHSENAEKYGFVFLVTQKGIVYAYDAGSGALVLMSKVKQFFFNFLFIVL